MTNLGIGAVHESDLERLGATPEAMRLQELQEIANVLGRLMSDHSNTFGGMPVIVQTNRITKDGRQISLEVR